MNKKIQVAIILLVIAFFVIGGTFAYNYLKDDYMTDNIINISNTSQTHFNSSSSQAVEEKTNTAPDFTVLDKDGNTVSLYDYFGKPIIINFWATWCGPCQDELPYFDKMYKEYGDEVVFLMVDLTDGVDDTVESVKKFITEKGYIFPLYFDTNNKGAEAYGINSIPHTIGIDKNGIIVANRIGSLNEEKLLSIINEVK